MKQVGGHKNRTEKRREKRKKMFGEKIIRESFIYYLLGVMLHWKRF